jgi:hypothetical protein
MSRCSRLDFRIDEGSLSCLAAPHLLRARHARPLPSLRGFLLNGLQRPFRAAPLLSPCRSALSHRAAAPRALNSIPALSPTASPTLPHTCACAFPHRELRAQACTDRSTTRHRPHICTRTPARRRPARPPLLAHGSCTHRLRAAHVIALHSSSSSTPLPDSWAPVLPCRSSVRTRVPAMLAPLYSLHHLRAHAPVLQRQRPRTPAPARSCAELQPVPPAPHPLASALPLRLHQSCCGRSAPAPVSATAAAPLLGPPARSAPGHCRSPTARAPAPAASSARHEPPLPCAARPSQRQPPRPPPRARLPRAPLQLPRWRCPASGARPARLRSSCSGRQPPKPAPGAAPAPSLLPHPGQKRPVQLGA